MEKPKEKNQSRKRRGISHFLSLPFILSNEGKTNYNLFVNSLPSDYKLFVYDKQLHITFLVLNLHSEDEINKAKDLFNTLKEPILQLIKPFLNKNGIKFL